MIPSLVLTFTLLQIATVFALSAYDVFVPTREVLSLISSGQPNVIFSTLNGFTTKGKRVPGASQFPITDEMGEFPIVFRSVHDDAIIESVEVDFTDLVMDKQGAQPVSTKAVLKSAYFSVKDKTKLALDSSTKDYRYSGILFANCTSGIDQYRVNSTLLLNCCSNSHSRLS
jgi:hypothetical protein